MQWTVILILFLTFRFRKYWGMDKNEIADLIEIKHQELFTWLEQQPQENWELGPKEKWWIGQYLPDSIIVFR